jgi:hypothetical protein
MRDKLGLLTRLNGEPLAALCRALEEKIADIARVEKIRLSNERGSARDYDVIAVAIENFIATLERSPRIVESLRSYGLSMTALTSCHEVAKHAVEVLREPARRGRPAGSNCYRNGLARAAARILREHCPSICQIKLRHGIAEVLIAAGYQRGPDPGKNADKFDEMTRARDDRNAAIDAELERERAAFEERWGDHIL